MNWLGGRVRNLPPQVLCHTNSAALTSRLTIRLPGLKMTIDGTPVHRLLRLDSIRMETS
jgi:hypothetical protein